MPFILQNPIFNSPHKIKPNSPNITQLNPSKPHNFPINQNPFQFPLKIKYPIQKNLFLLHNHQPSLTPIEEIDSNSIKFSPLDDFLSLIESICVISSMVIALCNAVNWVYVKRYNSGFILVSNRVLVWLLVGAVGVGYVIRRREWDRVFGAKTGVESGGLGVRVEKLEESMKSVVTIVRMLSRQLEKLGNRFRVTRKSLKVPISEAAALAKKNSEATRALALQEDILETELAEIQKVLLAMQDQQQRQLELILTIAKSSKLLDRKRAPSHAVATNLKDSDNGATQVDGQPIQAVSGKKGLNNDQVLGSSSQ